MGDHIEGKVIVITGASSGLGEAAARHLAHQGARLALDTRRTDRIEALTNEIDEGGGEALAVTTDVTDHEQVKALVDAAVERFGRIYVLMNNAGMLWLGQAGAGADYAMAVALPMVLIGLGNGFALGPLTVAGVAGVPDRAQGAASGAVNAAHQLGGTIGLSVLVVVFAAADAPALHGARLLSHRIAADMTGGGVMLVVALAIALVFVVPVSPRPARAPA